MSVIEPVRRPVLEPVSGHRGTSERLRDAVDPTWRRILWWVTSRRTGGSLRPRVSSVTRLDGPAAERAREILARRLTP